VRFLIMSFWESLGFYAITMPLCSHQALMYSWRLFVRSPRRRSSPGQGILGLSPSKRNEGLGVGSTQSREAVGSRRKAAGSVDLV
jgi:hypothetical protein